MIKLQIKLIYPGCAEGHYIIKAKGFILAILSWGNRNGPLEGWGNFAYVPIDPTGNSDFYFCGSRGIPKEATHVYVRCFVPDFSAHEDFASEIPEKFLNKSCVSRYVQKFSVLTDLHLSSNIGKLKRILKMTQSNIVILLGDTTNDGEIEQFRKLEECIKEIVPEKIFFPVIGNHDVLHASAEKDIEGCESYSEFQRRMLTMATSEGFLVEYDKDSLAYSVQIKNIDIIGLQCVISGRKFAFPEGKQLMWLSEHLRLQNKAFWHMILCHAPLLAHNPSRNIGSPYLGKNKMLQEIVDTYGKIIFLSGHTHISPNTITGNVDIDSMQNNVYINCGSVVDMNVAKGKGIELMSSDWDDGCIAEISIAEDEIEICMSSVKTGTKFPRGYYCLNTKKLCYHCNIYKGNK